MTSLDASSHADTDPAARLRACWHPAAYGHEVGAAPHGATLLDTPIVLWRSRDGVVHAMHDLCVHRGTALSLGTVAGDELVCPYHGWRYGCDGACTLIPQLADPTRIPTRARVERFLCQERYGIVWVALDPPAVDLPDVPELEAADWKMVATGPFAWAADASRQLENFTDFGHFPFVHPGLLGDPDRTEVPPHTVLADGHILRYEIVRPEAPNTDDFPIFANETSVRPERRSRYEIHLPFTIVLRLGWGGSRGMLYFFTSQPTSLRTCRGYCVIGRNYDFDQPDSVLQRFEEVIFGQDQRIVESQRPEQVPFDLAAELHLTFDAVAVAYRRAMKRAGFA